MASKGLKSPWEPKLVTTTCVYSVEIYTTKAMYHAAETPRHQILNSAPSGRTRTSGRSLLFSGGSITYASLL